MCISLYIAATGCCYSISC